MKRSEIASGKNRICLSNGLLDAADVIRGEKTMEFEKLKEIILEVMNEIREDEISEEVSFINDLGADSLDILQIVMGIEEMFEIEIRNEDIEKIATIGDAVDQIKNAVN